MNCASTICRNCYDGDYGGLQDQDVSRVKRGRNLLRQGLQLEDDEIGFISGQRGGFDDACKLKTMFTKYN